MSLVYKKRREKTTPSRPLRIPTTPPISVDRRGMKI
jgi:hypothetical protein